MYPIVIVITSSAPRINGGAGEGIPNARQAKPNVNASTIPISGFMATARRYERFPWRQQMVGCDEANGHRQQ
jgi:hypothetical protein